MSQVMARPMVTGQRRTGSVTRARPSRSRTSTTPSVIASTVTGAVEVLVHPKPSQIVRGQRQRVVEADALRVEAALDALLRRVDGGDEDADVEQAGQLLVGRQAQHRAQRQALAIDVALVALRRGAGAVAGPPKPSLAKLAE